MKGEQEWGQAKYREICFERPLNVPGGEGGRKDL